MKKAFENNYITRQIFENGAIDEVDLFCNGMFFTKQGGTLFEILRIRFNRTNHESHRTRWL